MNCRVVVEAAIPVYDVETLDEAIRIAISKTGEMLNPDLNYVDINMGTRTSPSGEELQPAFIAADEALVALELEMTVFNVEREEHASRIARKEIGQRLRNIPLEVLEVVVLDDEESESADKTGGEMTSSSNGGDSSDDESVDDDRSDTESDNPDEDSETPSSGSTPEDGSDDDSTATDSALPPDSDDDVLPEFEELLDDK